MLKTPEGKFVKEKIDGNPVMMFAKTTCTYCTMAKKALDETQVIYEVEEIDKRSDCDKLQDLFKELTGERTVSGVVSIFSSIVNSAQGIYHICNVLVKNSPPIYLYRLFSKSQID